MYIYRIESSAECEESEDGIYFDIDYVTHEKRFSKNEFFEMCQNVLNKQKEKYNHTLKIGLRDEYGFKFLEPLYDFRYEEEFK